MITLKSQVDDSVNFVFNGDFPGSIEARYVRRGQKYFACYLSSQTGCNQGCRMCHLTATKQTKKSDVTLNQYLEQATTVFDHYDKNCPKAEIVHFNFMARGEAFNNPEFIANGTELFTKLVAESTKRGLFPRFLISTIMPECIENISLSKTFPVINPEIYYSVYSLDPAFRRKWLPKAMFVGRAFDILREYQDNTKKIIKLHWAFIEGENDSLESVGGICDMVKMSGLRVDVAIVRYNPYDERYGKESKVDIIERNVSAIKNQLPFSRIKVVTRVGPDVKASCGMFIEPGGV